MRIITYRDALREALQEEMERDKNVFLLGEDVGLMGGVFGVSYGLQKRFGTERVIDTPIAESAIAGVAVGAAMGGSRPVAEIMFIDFATMCMDAIVNQAAKVSYYSGGQVRVPVVFRTQGGIGRSNGAQHSQSLEAWFCHVPGLTVVMPSNPCDAKGLLKSSIRYDGPVVFIEHKGLYGMKGEVPDGEVLVPLGKAEIKRHGKDVTIVSWSRQVNVVLEAAEEAGKKGIEAEVIDLRTLVPLDKETILQSVRKTKHLVIVQEASLTAGYASEITAIVQQDAFDYLDAPIVRVCGANVPIPFGPRLEAQVIPNAARVLDGISEVLS